MTSLRHHFGYILSFVCTFALQISKAETPAAVVEQEYLKTITFSTAQAIPTDTILEKNNKITTFNPSTLSSYDQHAIACNLLKKGTGLQELNIIDAKFIRKMELLCGSASADQHLLHHIDRTQSLFGKIALAHMLINPTDKQEILTNRQTFIKTIVNTQLENNDLSTLFGSLRGLENNILLFWHQENEASQQLFERLYFSETFNFLNKSTLALECKTRLRNLGTFLMLSLPVLPEIGTTILQKGKQTTPNDIADAVTKYFKSFYPFPLAFKDKSPEEIRSILNKGESFGDHCIAIDIHTQNAIDFQISLLQKGIAPLDQLKNNDDDLNAHIRESLHKELTHLSQIDVQAKTKPIKLAMGAGKLCLAALTLWQMKKAINEAQLNTSTTNYLHKSLISLANYIDIIKAIHAKLVILDGTNEIDAFRVLSSYFDGTAAISSEAKQLFAMLNSSTFKGNPSFFTITGRVLAAHKMMKTVKDEFAPFFIAAGEMEAYYSTAQLYAEHQSMPAKFCFVDFATSDKPYIQATNFWNPFIDANKVITNNVIFNNSVERHNVILTGPNTGGKSTIIKAVALNLLLAQTFGIAAAENLKLTPFSTINCYLNITDDITSGTSLFHAEIKRAKELIDQVKDLKSDAFCFTIMDEVFSGTNAEGGAEYAYKFADELGKFENTILVIATHFGNMIELEKNSNFKNMCVTAEVLENGTIRRPFKLEEGPFNDPENKVLKALLEQEGIFK